MGSYLSTGSQSSCQGRSSGDTVSGSCLGIGVRGRNRTFSDHMFTKQGRMGIDQDARAVCKDFISKGAILCGISDGQGRDNKLNSHPNCSGGNAITIVKQGSDLFAGGIGDFRAILGSKDSSDSLVAKQLTVDLNSVFPRERERIKECHEGEFALQDEPEVPRVCLPFDNTSALAMARAFGKFCLKDYGLISIPKFSHHLLTDNDLFVVLALDGVWDVLSNEEVVEIVHSASTRSSAAQKVVEAAACRLKLKYPTLDCCRVTCLFLNGKLDLVSENEEQPSSVTLQTNQMCSTADSDSDEEQRSEPSLGRNNMVQLSGENDQFGGLSTRSEGNGEKMAEDENLLGLEGVTIVNSLVQLP